MTADSLRLKRIRSFVTLAGRELRAAELLAAELPAEATFQAQQSVEKLLRAVIEAEDKRAGTTHDIRQLADLIGSQHALRQSFLALEDLSSAATRYRYPSGSGGLAAPPTSDELRTTLAAIRSLTIDVIRFLETRQLISKG
ncbi:HEPN domain-containing protein [Oharaeibacter diazotrophicus]|uniref:HEPN domain-containing protein n=1 Tax=Oharaeibacter diazotrophicus TaxID=1920512 RepID=A0A4R6RKP1_9HYPH|nr:HEPN domain-containing protein [Oharaeibacter diazotrophicus]TDP86675.1 HEPN domain-containing protein [Oharaeibacter diazotrophicus]BBE71383.1 HEPN domain protein [Pleomorphomonas sp. SM30]GLS78140.1 hypothetical protein GCM10007904_34770 [Oharaeibacter diazotrophicus]